MDNLPEVQLRSGFSDRNNIDKINDTIQLISLDKRTRIAIINNTSIIIDLCNSIMPNNMQLIIKQLLSKVYNCEVNYKAIYPCDMFLDKLLYNTIRNDNYDKVFTVIEYLINLINNYSNDKDFKPSNLYNICFEEEYVGYRFVDEKIVAITDAVEIKEIENACNNIYNGCKAQIKKALSLLADRDKKDYKNSIKESISAVESICKIISGKDKATLGDALKILEKKNNLKGQLKIAFEKLYNYTNDKGGIRHSEGLFESNVSFEEAKFMLVCCSAFVNYLISEYGKSLIVN